MTRIFCQIVDLHRVVLKMKELLSWTGLQEDGSLHSGHWLTGAKLVPQIDVAREPVTREGCVHESKMGKFWCVVSVIAPRAVSQRPFVAILDLPVALAEHIVAYFRIGIRDLRKEAATLNRCGNLRGSITLF